MKLLVVMYHRAVGGPLGNPPETLDAHFGHIARTHANVLPGERLSAGRLNVCLSFDDAYFDFYARVFPLLVRHRLRAVLAVPVGVVRESVAAGRNSRLGLSADEAFAHPARGGFCVWDELKEMAESGHVAIAAHGYFHRRLDRPAADLAAEVDAPETILSTRLGRPVTSFVFPFGRFSRAALRRARRRYRHCFRIGGALNRSWDAPVLYRVDGDAMAHPGSLFEPRRLARYHLRYFWNRLRSR